ncbi:LruC domain-containing protein [Oscillatoria amoena NRMC-F 0135]|nr:LruC domain-containing protein [Oscillatoria amoena NRMC-F 0135]
MATQKLFGTGDDASEPGSNRYYRSQNNLPWMISVSRSIPYAAEKVEFSNAFPYFVKWAESEGRSYEDWYMDQSGYRNQKFIYSR